MGCWSVSCGISNITIASGHECAILPLKRSKGLDYQEWQPATLPIFGKYNDYGSMHSIVKDENTKLIEEHFGVTIEEFVTLLVDGKHTYNRQEAKDVMEKINDVDGIEEMRFMWINKEVYDFMTNPLPDNWSTGKNEYGTPEFMKLFGFKLDKKATEARTDRKKVYKKGDVTMYSDGRRLFNDKLNSIYRFEGMYDGDEGLVDYFDIPEELHYLKDITKVQAWRLMDPDNFRSEYGYLLNDRYTFDFLHLELRGKKDVKEISAKYYYDLEKFGDSIAGLFNLFMNLYPMSGEFRPHVLYLTPQCGDFEGHSRLLKKFSEINESYCEYEEEEA